MKTISLAGCTLVELSDFRTVAGDVAILGRLYTFRGGVGWVGVGLGFVHSALLRLSFRC